MMDEVDKVIAAFHANDTDVLLVTPSRRALATWLASKTGAGVGQVREYIDKRRNGATR